MIPNLWDKPARAWDYAASTLSNSNARFFVPGSLFSLPTVNNQEKFIE
jgi:hypothetical protein